MLKVTACLDDALTEKIIDIVFQLDGLVDELEEKIGKDLPVPKIQPLLTVI